MYDREQPGQVKFIHAQKSFEILQVFLSLLDTKVLVLVVSKFTVNLHRVFTRGKLFFLNFRMKCVSCL